MYIRKVLELHNCKIIKKTENIYIFLRMCKIISKEKKWKEKTKNAIAIPVVKMLINIQRTKIKIYV